MNSMLRLLPVMLLLNSLPVMAQDKDFLTPDEVEKVRLLQEPNLRLPLYVQFARQRMDQLTQLFEKEKPGRSLRIHDLLEEYTKIVEAMDFVTDDALRRGLPVAEGLKAVAKEEGDMLKRLEAWNEAEQHDRSRYDFVLTTALETTRDSLEAAQSDLTARTVEAKKSVVEEKKEREALMSTKELEEKKKVEAKEASTKKKPPTLRRKGEKAPDHQP
jgi:hypothetical protein